jgi:hypothetical protein
VAVGVATAAELYQQWRVKQHSTLAVSSSGQLDLSPGAASWLRMFDKPNVLYRDNLIFNDTDVQQTVWVYNYDDFLRKKAHLKLVLEPGESRLCGGVWWLSARGVCFALEVESSGAIVEKTLDVTTGVAAKVSEILAK